MTFVGSSLWARVLVRRRSASARSAYRRPAARDAIHRRASRTATPALLALGTMLAFEPMSLGVPCAGDCDGDGVVVVNELVRGVNVALTNGPVDGCRALDRDGNGTIRV